MGPVSLLCSTNIYLTIMYSDLSIICPNRVIRTILILWYIDLVILCSHYLTLLVKATWIFKELPYLVKNEHVSVLSLEKNNHSSNFPIVSAPPTCMTLRVSACCILLRIARRIWSSCSPSSVPAREIRVETSRPTKAAVNSEVRGVQQLVDHLHDVPQATVPLLVPPLGDLLQADWDVRPQALTAVLEGGGGQWCVRRVVSTRFEQIVNVPMFTCIIVLSSVRKVHCATTGKAWHTSMSDGGGLVLRTTVVRMSMDVWHREGGGGGGTSGQIQEKFDHYSHICHLQENSCHSWHWYIIFLDHGNSLSETCVSLRTTYSAESRWDLVGRSLHDADQRGDETHLHGALAAFDLSQLLKDVLSQRRHHRVWGEETETGPETR